MALLALSTKSSSRLRLSIIATGVLLILLLCASASSPKVRTKVTKVTSDIHKALKAQDVAKIERAIVMGTVDPDMRQWWTEADQIKHNFTGFLYWMGDWPQEPYLTPVTQKGREASAYLSFIVKHYNGLPKYTYFVHDNEGQWHNDVAGHKTENVLPLVRTEAIDALGYVNLRCIHEPGCPPDVKPHDPEPWMIEKADTRARFKDIYTYLFNTTEEAVPHLIGGLCCAQFVVTRETIRQRPKADYERMLHWLEVYNDNDYDKGWIFEKLWHVIFGKEAVNCPSEAQCRCDLYGWCGPLIDGRVLTPVAAPRTRTKERPHQA